MRLRGTAGIALALSMALSTSMVSAPGVHAEGNNYPTIAVADYVFGCMASNGQTRQALEQCACSIDVIAAILPYEKFIEAETILRMRLVSGEKGSLFRTDAAMKAAVADLKRAQAEAEIRCF